jgi:hypothetical protein
MNTLHFTTERIAQLIAKSHLSYQNGLCTSDEHLAVLNAYRRLINNDEVWSDVLRIVDSIERQVINNLKFKSNEVDNKAD